MGAWGVLAFDNDAANDWAYELDDVDDLSLVESVFDAALRADVSDVDSNLASSALAACEVLARLRGRPGYTNAYTEKVDKWVAAHPLRPSNELLQEASVVIDRVLNDSELRDLWQEEGDTEWRQAVENLRSRLMS